MYLRGGSFGVSHTKPTGWFHFVLNYIGPNDGEGIRVYYDGIEVASYTTSGSGLNLSGVGRIVVGREYTDVNFYYTTLHLDELIFFNRSLTSDEITALATAV